MFPDSSAPTLPAANQAHTRTGIEKVLAPVIATALKSIPGLDTSSPDAMRRIFRALLTIGVKLLLDAGAPPDFIAGQAMLAIGTELETRAKVAKEMGATQAPASA